MGQTAASTHTLHFSVQCVSRHRTSWMSIQDFLMFKLCFYIQEYQPRSILEHHFEHKNNKTAQLKNEQFYIFSLSIEAQQVKPKMLNKTVLKQSYTDIQAHQQNSSRHCKRRDGKWCPGCISVPQAGGSCWALCAPGLNAWGHEQHRYSYNRSLCQKHNLAHKAAETIWTIPQRRM